eukprot:m.976705 g.976705  ORF g.976705 m.976705 type:complete len:67 (+) comp23947_c1_seq5:5014-5214(+)
MVLCLCFRYYTSGGIEERLLAYRALESKESAGDAVRANNNDNYRGMSAHKAVFALGLAPPTENNIP